MKKYLSKLLCLLFFITSLYKVHSQQANPLVVESKFSYAEKIYLQLSSTVLTRGKTVWFKAIVTDLAHVPTGLSGVLHVDLIDFDQRIIDKKLLKIENGTCDGFFDLQEDLSPGRYLIRAYTEWNKNFEDEFISKNYIDVYAAHKIGEDQEAIQNVMLTDIGEGQFEISAKAYPRLLNPKYRGKLKLYIYTESKTDSVVIKKSKKGSYNFQYLLPKDVVKARMEFKLDSVRSKNLDWRDFNSYSKTVVVNKEYVDLQFFPEGGKFVEGLTSVIAFKALDYNNKGKKVKGYIVDQNNEIIIPIQSNTLGMGLSYITPEGNKRYYARIKGKDGITYKFPLPQVSKTGVVLKVKEVPEYIVISLNSNNLEEDTFHIKVQLRGVEQDQFNLQVKDGFVNTALEKSTLPEGILKITVQNKMDEIVCERLFFNYKEEERITITASPNSKQYTQRDKTSISIHTKAKDSSALVSNLSVLVVDKEQLGGVNDARCNLLSYFLLNSELKGSIERPSSYFNKQNKSRKRDMDALLLTQGWSNYKYIKETVQTDFKYLPEKRLSVSGTVRGLLNTKKVLKKPIELTLVYGPLNVAIQEVDTKGNFYFELEDYFKDTFRVVIQSKSKKGNKKDVTINLNSYKGPKVGYEKTAQVYLADSINTNVVENDRTQKLVEEAYTIAEGTIGLDEVTLKGYNLTPAREKMMDFHGPPDFVIENKELMEKTEKWHSGLFDLLQFNYFDDIDVVEKEADGFSYLLAVAYSTNSTRYVIDGIPVDRRDYPYLESLPIEGIKSFELIKDVKNPRYTLNKLIGRPDIIIGRMSFICIYTYAGKGFHGVQRSKGIYKGFVSGFATKREFYAPKYEYEYEIDNQMPDVRSVVYWVPNIDTDAEGNAQVEFYNGDLIGEKLIIVEGITKEGKIGYYQTTYGVGNNDSDKD